MELSVPEAVIKFRQGIGRLMRRSSDRGSIIVLDRRLYTKQYGSVKNFLREKVGLTDDDFAKLQQLYLED